MHVVRCARYVGADGTGGRAGSSGRAVVRCCRLVAFVGRAGPGPGAAPAAPAGGFNNNGITNLSKRETAARARGRLVHRRTPQDRALFVTTQSQTQQPLTTTWTHDRRHRRTSAQTGISRRALLANAWRDGQRLSGGTFDSLRRANHARQLLRGRVAWEVVPCREALWHLNIKVSSLPLPLHAGVVA